MSDEMLQLSVRKRWGDFSLAFDGEVRLEGITALFGPSGSGKTALLRCVAGLDRPDSGRVLVGDECWFDGASSVNLPPHRRAVGLMFQDGRLFSHLDVAGNLRFADSRSRSSSPTFAEVVDSLRIDHLLRRGVDSLSGGERQRVALGRTLLRRPRLLLLDEPLSALDWDRRREIIPYLEELPERFGLPAIYVSHSMDEVARVADRVLLLADGRVQAYGPTADIFERLDLQPLTGRAEGGVLLEAVVRRHDQQLKITEVMACDQPISMPIHEHLDTGETVRLRVRARDVSIAIRRPKGISIQNVLPGRIARIEAEPDSAFVEVLLHMGPAHLRSRITHAALRELNLMEGQEVFALLKVVSLDRRLI